MCKGFLLAEYIKNRANDGVNFDQILYVGDGTNDFCPGLKLASTDVFCVRKGFKLESMLNSHEERRNQLKAEVCFWESAEELLKFI